MKICLDSHPINKRIVWLQLSLISDLTMRLMITNEETLMDLNDGLQMMKLPTVVSAVLDSGYLEESTIVETVVRWFAQNAVRIEIMHLDIEIQRFESVILAISKINSKTEIWRKEDGAFTQASLT